MSFLFRDHRLCIDESMKTVRVFEERAALVAYIQEELDKFGKGVFDCEKITIEPYCYDNRICWDSHIVSLTGYGVLGFTDREVKE